MSCNDLILDIDIEYIYADNNLITSNEVITRCTNRNLKKASIHIYQEAVHMCVGGKIGAILREYHRDYPLASPSNDRDRGKVVTHEQFFLKPEYRCKNILKTIHPKEIEVYQRLGFEEIQLEAEFDGFVVWKKMFFKFNDDFKLSLMKVAIQAYLEDVKGLSNKDIASIIKKNPFGISVEYLKDTTIDFSDWVYQKYPEMGTVDMYKELI